MKMTMMNLGIRMRMLNQFIGLYIREVKNTYKNPAIIVVSIVQPLLWIVFFGSSFSAAPRLFLESFFHTDNYIAFLLSGQLSTSMLFVGMFSSLSLIQDKKSGYLRRIMVTPTRNYVIFLAKVLGASTRGMLQVPIVFLGVMLLGVTLPGALGLAAFVIALFLLSLGLSSIYLLITMKSSDWQIPTVIANFINLPLMFSSTALFPKENFPPWMQIISDFNPVSYSSTFGREIIISGNNNINTIPWIYFIYLLIFALVMLIIGMFVATKTLKIE
jgi:ABC-2 type transport system permease protein